MHKRYIWPAVIILTGAFIFTGCFFSRLTKHEPYRETRFFMDTVVEIVAYGPEAQPAVQAAFDEFQRLEELSSHFKPDSQVTKLNQLAGSTKLVVDSSLLEMMILAKEASEKTGGAFDVSVGPLTDLWGIGHKGEYIPDQTEIDQVMPLVGYRMIAIDEAAHTVFLTKPGMRIDLGGIAKGYAVNRAAGILEAAHVESAMINAGGDIQVIGKKPDGQPWRIGVQHPRESDGVIAKITLAEWDMAETSGDYQRYFIKDDVRYAHILDPATGRQPREIASVTLLYDHKRTGFIPSSAFQVLGVEAGLAVLQKFPGVEAIFVTVDGRIVTTPGLNGKVELTTGKSEQ